MTSPTADALALVGILAVAGVVAVVAREAFRPQAPRYGRESDDWGDQPNVSNLSHIGTHTGTEA